MACSFMFKAYQVEDAWNNFGKDIFLVEDGQSGVSPAAGDEEETQLTVIALSEEEANTPSSDPRQAPIKQIRY